MVQSQERKKKSLNTPLYDHPDSSEGSGPTLFVADRPWLVRLTGPKPVVNDYQTGFSNDDQNIRTKL